MSEKQNGIEIAIQQPVAGSHIKLKKMNNAQVQAVQVEDINLNKLLYVTIKTERGRVAISIGEKNYAKLTELLTSTQTDANKQPGQGFTSKP